MENSNPLISVIMPCYNASEFLSEALDSILYQTYRNIEIICLDDGSTDETLSILKSYQKKDERILIIQNTENLKLIKTLNKGIELASGDYIARMDSDDISLPTRFSDQLNAIIKSDADLVGTDVIPIDESGKIIGKNLLWATDEVQIRFATFFINPIIHPSILCRSELLKKNLYLLSETAMHVEDYELWSRLSREKYKLINIEQKLLKLRYNTKSVSRKFESLQKENFTSSAKLHFSKFFNLEMTVEDYKLVTNRFENYSFRNSRRAIFVIDSIKSRFLTIEKISKTKRYKISKISTFQKIDVLIQFIRHGNIMVKFFGFIYLIKIIASLKTSDIKLIIMQKTHKLN